jgi:hypothetical protein
MRERHIPPPDDFVAELAEAAYQVVLRHGLRGPFLDVELELWGALREAFARALVAQIHAWPLPEAV